MAAEAGFGMDKGKLKVQLNKAKGGPVNCAVGKGKDAGAAYVMLDHVKQPKALESLLSKEFPDIKDVRRGTVTIDEDDNPKLVLFHLNKPSSGLAMRLVKVLKQVGYSKVKMDFEDGSPGEDLLEDEEAQEAEAAGDDAPQQQAAGPDPAAVKGKLTGLVQKIAGADAAQKAALVGLAKEAQTLLAGGDAAGAEEKVAALEKALDGGAGAEAAQKQPAAGGTVAYAKSRLAWLGVRKKIEGDLDKLQGAMVEYFKDDEDAPDIAGTFADRVKPIMEALDESLADALDDASNEADPAKRAAKIEEAKQIIERYQAFVSSEPTIAELDENPFVPMKMQATLNATLTTLASAIR